MDELPGAGEILFSNDFTLGQAAVTWCYRDVSKCTRLAATTAGNLMLVA